MDNFFFVNWEDEEKAKHIVGMLAHMEGIYYFRYNSSHQIMEEARKNGFTDIPSFTDEERLYESSNDLFDFFKMRIPEVQEAKAKYGKYEPCELLKETKGKSLTDSFTVEEMLPERVQVCKDLIKQLKEQQQKEADTKSHGLDR